MKRIITFLLVIFVWCSCSLSLYACDENQSNIRVTEILFGDNAPRYSSDENVKALLSALYLCCEQYDNDGKGQKKIDYLNSQKVKKIPQISDINIGINELIPCAHIAWLDTYLANNKIRDRRKAILQNTVEHVFDFGWSWNYLLGGVSEKSKSFTALLYYFHILADYLGDDPEKVAASVKGEEISSYFGISTFTLNNDWPQFTDEFKKNTDLFMQPGELDYLNRCGMVYATLGKESMEFIGPRPANLPNPSGWKQNSDMEYYKDIVGGGDVYNRCHLIAREFCGIDNLHNLITGTTYLNQTMGEYEDKVKSCIETGKHVAYRVTPVYKGNNLIASGVQMEAFSVEDKGKDLHFNVYCYNVQPGVSIDYETGGRDRADLLTNSDKAIPFAIYNASENNPDLIYEIKKYLEIVFENQKKHGNYTMLIKSVETIGNEARSISGKASTQVYYELEKYKYKLYKTLVSYVPLLLMNEDFFKSRFR